MSICPCEHSPELPPGTCDGGFPCKICYDWFKDGWWPCEAYPETYALKEGQVCGKTCDCLKK